MKLVLTYTDSDDCTYSYDLDVCFTYESKEKAISDFTTQLLKQIYQSKSIYDHNSLVYKEIQKLQSMIVRTKKEDQDKINKKVSELYRSKLPNEDRFFFGNNELSLRNFYKPSMGNEQDYIEEPRILTLEEWFDSKVA